MASEIDFERLHQIREVMGVRLAELVGGMLATMRDAIDQTERAVSDGKLEDAAKAAHACRNDALMLGAKRLLRALGSLEQAARVGDVCGAEQALVAVREAWPPTREELCRIAADTEQDSP